MKCVSVIRCNCGKSFFDDDKSNCQEKFHQHVEDELNKIISGKKHFIRSGGFGFKRVGKNEKN